MFIWVTMNNSIEITDSNNRYIEQFNRAVLDYDLFMAEERQQKKTRPAKKQRKMKRLSTVYKVIATGLGLSDKLGMG